MNILRIDERLKELDMSQSELARRLHISKQAVQYWCSGQLVPRLPMLIKVAKELHCHVSDLINEDAIE